MASIKLKGDTSGEVTISAPAVAGTTTLELPATSSTLATQNALGVRNLIINGDMRIAQRATTATASTGTSYYTVDRFNFRDQNTGGYTIDQSTDAPTNFTHSTKITVTSADTSIASGERYWISTILEGQNIAHLNFGSSDAQTVTLSFYVKSSLTGTFSGALQNDGANRTYAFEYTISSANTWERKTVTIDGDTTGTWLTTNGVGFRIYWDLGAASDRQITAGSWQASSASAATGASQVIANNGATFYITGVQLEVGDTATPFEHRPYDMELARCQRYFRTVGDGMIGRASSASVVYYSHHFENPMRATPTMSIASGATVRFGNFYSADYVGSSHSIVLARATNISVVGQINGFSGMTTADMLQSWQTNITGWLHCSAEL